MAGQTFSSVRNLLSFRERLNGAYHAHALWLYMVVVFGHWLEHIAQAYQVFVLHWPAVDAGGVLGLWFPELAASEVLHFAYNLSLLAGLWLLRPGFSDRARLWWDLALVAQGWHFFEHFLLQVQWLTGVFLFGADHQIGILQLWIPRVELHLIYNTVVFIPMMVAMVLHFRRARREMAAHPDRATRDAGSSPQRSPLWQDR